MTSTWTILIAAIIMTGASVTLLLRRLISPKAGDAPSGSAENVYHDQLRQLDHEVATGEIRGGEAKVARTEIARRLLSAAGQNSSSGSVSLVATRLMVNRIPTTVCRNCDLPG